MHERRRARQQAPLIGRDDEISLLRLAASRVQRERAPQLITIFGQAGVGKSRLLAEFADGLDNARVVVGRCVPYGDGITYLPLVEVASALAGILDDDRAEVALAKLRRSVEDTLPANQVEGVVEAVAWTMGLALPGRATGVAIDGDVKGRLHEAWARYLAALGREALLVLVVDDIHWASQPLLDLLDDLVTGLEQTAVLILCPSRPELLDQRPSWGTGRLTSSSLTLSPLSAQSAELLLRALLETETVPEHVAGAHPRAGGGQSRSSSRRCSRCSSSRVLSRSARTAGRPPTSWRPRSSRTRSTASSRRASTSSRPPSVTPCDGARSWVATSGPRPSESTTTSLAGLGRRGIVFEQADTSFSGRREFAFKHALTHDVDVRIAASGGAARAPPSRSRMDLGLSARSACRDHGAGRVPLRAGASLRRTRRRPRAPFVRRPASPPGTRRCAAARTPQPSACSSRALELAPDAVERARALLLAARADVATRRYERAVERLDEAIRVADRSRRHEPARRCPRAGRRG